jgi:S1-C subfamily serine protease
VRKTFLSIIVVLVGTVSAFAQTPKTQDQTPPQELVSQVKRAVVIVTTYDEHLNALQQGSGFFISPARVVTNFHVIDSAKQIRIKTFNGETVQVHSVLASDKQADLAILQIAALCRDTTTLEVSDISPAEGDSLVVVSNPKGSSWKVTAGQVATTWNFEHLGSRMQITASLKPGSSGGPVVNLQGHVIGIAVMHTGSADDLDFAVPAERLKDLQTSISSTRPVSPAPRN